MKQIPAIVEQAEDLAAQQVIVWRDEEQQAEASGARHEQQASAARAVAKQRRLMIGELCAKQREKWPTSGPRAKGWGEWLARAKLDDSTAWRYIDAWKNRNKPPSDDVGDPSHSPDVRGNSAGDAKADRINPKGGSDDEDRGTWCTSEDWARAIGAFDLDPFSNPRSKIVSVTRCMLEDGGDAFGGGEPGAVPGLYLTGDAHGAAPTSGRADELTRVFLQPPFKLVADAVAHYGHTRFVALLRWSPDVKSWFVPLWPLVAVVCQPFGERMEFSPPPGVDKSGDMPFPHALYYAHESDVTDEVRARCIVWRVDHSLDCARSNPTALHIVR